MTSITIEHVRAAEDLVRPHIHRTPLFHSQTLSDMTETDLYLKAENLQRTGSFKPRGVTNAILRLSPEERQRGVVTFSAGNTAQALAYGARLLDVPAVVVMPDTAPRAKVEAVQGYGAEVVLVPADDLIDRMEQVARERGLAIIHPFGNADVIAGHGTAGVEILEDLPDVEMVVVPVGGGGLVAGIATAIKALSPSVHVVGVEPERADVVTRSLAAGRPLRQQPSSIADGLNSPSGSEISLDVIQRLVDEIVLVTDEEIARAMGLVLQRTKLLVEPAGAAAVAALLAGKVPHAAGTKTVAVLSGGNMDVGRLAELIEGNQAATPEP